MDTKRIVIGTLVGGITMFLVGQLIWRIALTTPRSDSKAWESMCF